MPVHCIVAHVELPADEPATEDRRQESQSRFALTPDSPAAPLPSPRALFFLHKTTCFIIIISSSGQPPL